MKEEIIRDISDSMLDDIRMLSSKFEKQNVGFASTMKKIKQLDGTAIKRTLAGAAASAWVGIGVAAMVEAGVDALNYESLAVDNAWIGASMALAATFGVIYDRLTDVERDKLPDALKDFKNADKLGDKELAALINSKTPEQYGEMTGLIQAYRSSPTYDGEVTPQKSTKMKM